MTLDGPQMALEGAQMTLDCAQKILAENMGIIVQACKTFEIASEQEYQSKIASQSPPNKDRGPRAVLVLIFS